MAEWSNEALSSFIFPMSATSIIRGRENPVPFITKQGFDKTTSGC